MDGAEEEGYRPEAEFEEDSRESLFDLFLSNSTVEFENWVTMEIVAVKKGMNLMNLVYGF